VLGYNANIECNRSCQPAVHFPAAFAACKPTCSTEVCKLACLITMCTASAQFLCSCELVVKGCLRRVTPQISIASAADWNNNRRNGAYGVYGIKAVRTTFAGFILLAASNALLILSLGTEPAHTSSAPITTGPGAAGVQSTRTLGGASAPLEGGNGQTVV